MKLEQEETHEQTLVRDQQVRSRLVCALTLRAQHTRISLLAALMAWLLSWLRALGMCCCCSRTRTTRRHTTRTTRRRTTRTTRRCTTPARLPLHPPTSGLRLTTCSASRMACCCTSAARATRRISPRTSSQPCRLPNSAQSRQRARSLAPCCCSPGEQREARQGTSPTSSWSIGWARARAPRGVARRHMARPWRSLEEKVCSPRQGWSCCPSSCTTRRGEHAQRSRPSACSTSVPTTTISAF